MKTQFTPGPWRVDGEMATTEETGNFYIYANKRWVAEAKGNHVNPVGREELEANARLIAAAPELLDALVKIKRQLDSECDHITDAVIIERIVSEAISKATGEKESAA